MFLNEYQPVINISHYESLSTRLFDSELVPDSQEVVRLLFQIASERLTREYSRLVFWLPTVAYVRMEMVVEYLQLLAKCIDVKSIQLRVVRVVPEELNDGAWRWLCVMEVM